MEKESTRVLHVNTALLEAWKTKADEKCGIHIKTYYDICKQNKKQKRD